MSVVGSGQASCYLCARARPPNVDFGRHLFKAAFHWHHLCWPPSIKELSFQWVAPPCGRRFEGHAVVVALKSINIHRFGNCIWITRILETRKMVYFCWIKLELHLLQSHFKSTHLYGFLHTLMNKMVINICILPLDWRLVFPTGDRSVDYSITSLLVHLGNPHLRHESVVHSAQSLL